MAVTNVAQRNIEIARKGYAAFDKQDIETVMDLLSEDVLWHGGLRGPLAGDYKGKTQVLELFGKFAQLTQGSYSADIHDILASDEHTVVVGTTHITRNGKTREDRFVDVIHPDSEGRVKEFWRLFEDEPGALAFLES